MLNPFLSPAADERRHKAAVPCVIFRISMQCAAVVFTLVPIIKRINVMDVKSSGKIAIKLPTKAILSQSCRDKVEHYYHIK